MNIEMIINELEGQGVEFWVEGENLRYRAPKGVIKKESLSQLVEKKKEIIAFVKNKKNADNYPIIIPDLENKNKPFDLTDIQKAYWLGRENIYELGAVSTYYYAEIDGFFDIDKLNNSWQKILDYHDLLRVVIGSDGRQQILKKVPEYKFIIYDLQKDVSCNCKLKEIREEMSHQVLPADKWPLFDIRVAIISAGKMRLFFGFDCLIGDAWSQQKVYEDWIDIYENRSDSLSKSSISFRDYVLAEKDLKKSNLYKKSREYWMNRIPDIEIGPMLPLRKKPAEIEKPKFIRLSFELGYKYWELIKNKASSRKITPTGILLSAFSYVLSNWSNSNKFTINLTLFNRLPLHPEIDDITGEFTSLNMLSVNLSKDKTFTENSLIIQKQLFQDLDNINFGGVEVIRELINCRREFNAGSLPIVFTSGLGLNSNEKIVGLSRLGNINYSITQTPQVWLDHQVYENGGALIFSWDFIEELFPANLIEEMFSSYCKLLKSLSSNDVIWDSILDSMVPSHQKEKRIVKETKGVNLSDYTLNQLFEIQVDRVPENIAIIDSGKTWTYEELDWLSENIAEQLIENGVSGNTLVAIFMEKGWEQVAAVLGILKSGAAYIPIDISIPVERIHAIIENSEAKIVLTQPWVKEVKKISDEVIIMNVVEELENKERINICKHSQRTSDLAYVIYTSGSTGIPKGVMIDHRGAVNTIADINNRFQISERDRVLALSNLNFDLSVYDIFGLLSAGGTIVMPKESKLKDPEYWQELVKDTKITIWNSVPALMQMLVEYNQESSNSLFNSLRLIFLSGDWIPLDLPSKIKKIFHKGRLISLGGATEASIWSVIYPVDDIDPGWKSIPYGKSMKNQRIQVLNESMEECPDWVTGMLYITGGGIAKGYWKDENRTNDNFILKDNGERFYKTGDLGRYLPDGNIEFLGRDDFQIKINGFRIELGEIESALNSHEDVMNSIATVLEFGNKSKVIVGYYEKKKNSDLEKNDLFSLLGKKLPEYMIPSTLVELDKIPLTSNGKINRKELPIPENIKSSKEEYIAPETDLEKELANIVTSIIGSKKISINQKFFDLGANSIDIVRIQAILVKKLKYDISVIDIFENSTIRELAMFCLNKERSKNKNISDSVTEKVKARQVAAAKKRERKLRRVRKTA